MQAIQATQPPLTLHSIVCNTGGKRFETVIQGKKITASFAANPDEKILKLVRNILIDSHTSNKTPIEK